MHQHTNPHARSGVGPKGAADGGGVCGSSGGVQQGAQGAPPLAEGERGPAAACLVHLNGFISSRPRICKHGALEPPHCWRPKAKGARQQGPVLFGPPELAARGVGDSKG